MRRHLPLASASAVALVVAILSLTMTDLAQAQVRSTIGVSAEVVESGPALAADQLVRQVVARAFELPQPQVPLGFAESGNQIAPRVTIVREQQPAYRATAVFAVASHIPRALVAAARSGGSDVRMPQPNGSSRTEAAPMPSRIVVYVEHVSN